MKKKLLTLMFSLLFIFVFALNTFAKSPYETYTYSYEGNYQSSPDAFTPKFSIQDIAGTTPLNAPTDIVSDIEGNIYISDTGNNRIVILDKNFQFKMAIESYIVDETEVKFKNPSGLFVNTHTGNLFVADTDNGNIVEFSSQHKFIRVVPAPKAELLPDDFSYRPIAVSVDHLNRFYVISRGTNMGVITFDSNGVFEGFIGAQKVKASVQTMFWRMFMSEKQLNKLTDIVPVSYNNINIDNRGFIYVTTSSINPFTLKEDISARKNDSPYSPIKKLNPSGDDVLNRNGFFPPVGDINFDAYGGKGKKKPSGFSEVIINDNNTYCVVDSAYNKIFTYDEYGNLLYVFGGTGSTDGLFSLLSSICFQGDNIVALDSSANRITVFEKTKYGFLIDEAIILQQQRKFSETIPVWQEIQKHNNNYDLAYIGIGKSLHEQGKYEEAMEYFQAVNNKDLYSKSMQKYRMQILKKLAIFIPILICILLWLISKFFKYAKNFNSIHSSLKQKRTIKEQLVYSFNVIFHPFNGFWELKHERRGGIGGATIILALTTLSMIVLNFGSGYLMQSADSTADMSITSSIINVLLPFTLWCIANWCLTSLMDGKGSFKDIFIATAYALLPIVLIVAPAAIISNFLVIQELTFVTYALNLAFFWTALLLFFGSMTTHDYSLGKNIFVCFLTIVGIGIILFLGFLFLNVSTRMVTFISNVFTEISFRL